MDPRLGKNWLAEELKAMEELREDFSEAIIESVETVLKQLDEKPTTVAEPTSRPELARESD